MAKIPFRWMPGSWGLKGKSRAIAEAEYYLEGEALEARLEEIDDEYSRDQIRRQIRAVEKRHRAGEIDENTAHKEIATLNNEPYVNVIEMDIDPQNPTRGVMELDFNPQFVAMLRDHGMTGEDDEIVNNWFNAVCNTVVKQAEQDKDWGLESSDARPPKSE